MTEQWIVFLVKQVLPPMAGCVLLAVCAKEILGLFNIFAFSIEVVGGPSDAAAEIGRQEDFLDYYQQLQQLRYSPTGVLRESTLQYSGKRELVLLCPDGECAAMLYRVSGGGPLVTFNTVFNDDAIVSTTNTPYESYLGDNYVAQRIPTKCVRTLLDAHKKQVTDFAKAGRTVTPCHTIETAAAWERRSFGHPMCRRSLRAAMAQELRVKLRFLVGVLLVVFLMHLPYVEWRIALGIASMVMLIFCAMSPFLLRRAYKQADQATIIVQKEADYRAGRDTGEPSVFDPEAEVPDEVVRFARIGWTARLADYLALYIGRPARAFDLQRGWLRSDERLDYLETICIPWGGTSANGEVETQAWTEGDLRDARRGRLKSAALGYVIIYGGFYLVLFGGVFTVAMALRAAGMAAANATSPWYAVWGLFPLSMLLLVTIGPSLYNVWYWLPVSLGRLVTDNGNISLQCTTHADLSTQGKRNRKCIVPLRTVSPGRYVLHGTARFWYPTGEKLGELAFHDNQPTGPLTLWHSNGQTKLQGTWNNGEKDGQWTYYSDEGISVASEQYQDGKLVQRIGNRESPWDQVSRYHWGTPIAFDARRLSQHMTTAQPRLSRRWSYVGQTCLVVLQTALLILWLMHMR